MCHEKDAVADRIAGPRIGGFSGLPLRQPCAEKYRLRRRRARRRKCGTGVQRTGTPEPFPGLQLAGARWCTGLWRTGAGGREFSRIRRTDRCSGQRAGSQPGIDRGRRPCAGVQRAGSHRPNRFTRASQPRPGRRGRLLSLSGLPGECDSSRKDCAAPSIESQRRRCPAARSIPAGFAIGGYRRPPLF